MATEIWGVVLKERFKYLDLWLKYLKVKIIFFF